MDELINISLIIIQYNQTGCNPNQCIKKLQKAWDQSSYLTPSDTLCSFLLGTYELKSYFPHSKQSIYQVKQHPIILNSFVDSIYFSHSSFATMI